MKTGSSTNSGAIILALILSVPAVFLIAVFWGGYVLSVLWGWFIVPLGVSSVSPLHAAGLHCIFLAFMGTRGVQKKDKSEDPWVTIFGMVASAILLPAGTLLVGWIIKTWM